MAKRIFLFTLLCFTFGYVFSQDVAITNNLPASGVAGQAIDAKYNLTKSPTMGSFAKFQVDLSAGFSAESIDLKGGNFTFENNRVKIVWVSLPGDASFDFVFKLTPSSSVSGNVNVTPQFFYLENNVKKEYTVPPVTINFGGSGSTVTTDNTSSGSNTSTTDNTTTTDNNTNTQSTGTTDNTASNNTSSNNTASNTDTQSTNNNTVSNNTSSNNTTSTAKSNVVYHVQLAALTNKPTKARFAQYGDVKIVEDAGLYKVLVGKFKTLDEARTYKKKLLANGTEGCFVVAYENGVRVKI